MRRLFTILLMLIAVSASAADPAITDIDRFVRESMTHFPDLPSLGVAVVRDGKPYFVRSYGLADVERNIKATENTGYYIASSTKSYVGLLASVMATRGVVDLDAPITKYLPEVKFAPEVNAQGVTLRSLLSHRSGISNDAIVSRTAFTGEHDPKLLVSILSHSKPIEAKYQYDNLGYVVTGLVLERVTGKKWQDLLESEIFKPLGMTRTTAYISKAKDVATAYDVDANLQRIKIQLVKTDATMHAAGGIVTTPVDAAKWLAANINRSILPAAAYAEAQKQQSTYERTIAKFKTTAYGFGWNLADYDGQRVLYHFGGYEGWRAHFSFMPDAKIGVAVLTNTSSVSAPLRDIIATYVYDRLLGKSDLDAKYATAASELRSNGEKGAERRRAEIEKRSQRPPSLIHDLAAYVGTYEGDTGRLTIARTADGLTAKLGQLHAKLEPYTEPDTARVELIPGTGEVLRFVIEGDRATTIKYNDDVLKRVQ